MGEAPAPAAPPGAPAEPTNVVVGVTTPEPVAPGEEALGDAGKKALDVERTARKELERKLRELEPLAQAAKDAEEANKSEVQKATEKLAKETEARKLAEQALMIQTVGAEKGVPANLIKFLTGSSKAEVEAAADELLSAMGDAKPSMPGRPTERMVNGKPSGNQLDSLDPVALIRMGRGQSPLK
jgi:hypothetical protein